MTPSMKLKPIKAIAPKSLSKHKILSKDEIIQKGRIALAYDFLYRKLGARTYQVRWIKDIMLRNTTQSRLPIIYASTGAGKTTTINMVLTNLNNLDSNNTLTVFSVPKTSQQVIYDSYNQINNQISRNGDTCIIISSATAEKVQVVRDTMAVSKETSYKEIMEFTKEYKHIIIMGSHEFLRLKMVDFFKETTILEKRNLRWFLDEVHKEMHSDGSEAFVVNLELHDSQKSKYSPFSKPLVDDMVNLNFFSTGFTGTPSKQQRGKHHNNGIFDYYPLSEEALLEVALNNTYLDNVRFCGKDYSLSFSDRYDQTLKNLAEGLQIDVYDRKGIGLLYIANSNVRYDEGVIKESEFHTKIHLPNFDIESVLYWFGGSQKYKLIMKDKITGEIQIGRYNPEKHNAYFDCYKSTDNIKSILNNNPAIKLVVVKNLLKDGFDYHEINTIYFGKEITRVSEFTPYIQPIGRGVRPGSEPLRLGFTFYSGKGYGRDLDARDYFIHIPSTKTIDSTGATVITKAKKNVRNPKYIDSDRATDLIEAVLDAKIVLTKTEYFELKETFKVDYLPLMTCDDCIDFSQRLDTTEYKNSIHELFHNTDYHIESLLKTSYGYDISLKEISTHISNTMERFMGSKPNMVKTAGQNAEDGFIFFPEEDKVVAFDVKVKLSSVTESVWIDSNNNNSVNLKDKTRGDGLINNHIMYIVFDVKIIDNKVDSVDMIVVEFDKEFTQAMKSNSLSLSKLTDKSTYKTNLYTRRTETLDIL